MISHRDLWETKDLQKEQHRLEQGTQASLCGVPAEKLVAVWEQQWGVHGRGVAVIWIGCMGKNGMKGRSGQSDKGARGFRGMNARKVAHSSTWASPSFYCRGNSSDTLTAIWN